MAGEAEYKTNIYYTLSVTRSVAHTKTGNNNNVSRLQDTISKGYRKFTSDPTISDITGSSNHNKPRQPERLCLKKKTLVEAISYMVDVRPHISSLCGVIDWWCTPIGTALITYVLDADHKTYQ